MSRDLRALVDDVLPAYGIDPASARVRLVKRSFNTVFRVDAADTRFALRVGAAERIHNDGTEIVETLWMRALRADGVAMPPEIFDAVDGSPVVARSRPDVAGERVCVLFGWVPGRALSEAMTPPRAREMGSLAARLHEHAANTSIAGAESVLVADRVLYWRLDDNLADQGSLVAEARERADTALRQLWTAPPHAPHLLHGDLLPANVMVSRRSLVPIDFQDLVWGFDIQDIAMSLFALRLFPDAETLRAEFRRGYADVRPYPEVDPETMRALFAARQLNILNLVLALRRPGFEQSVERAMQVFDALSRRRPSDPAR